MRDAVSYTHRWTWAEMRNWSDGVLVVYVDIRECGGTEFVDLVVL